VTITRRVVRPTVTSSAPAIPVPVAVSEEITYRGYRIEPGSYAVNSIAWSPRAVVSTRADGSWARGTPLYSPNTARFPTRDEADRRALEVAKAWVDAAIAQQRG
jgi:hypothetical protein